MKKMKTVFLRNKSSKFCSLNSVDFKLLDLSEKEFIIKAEAKLSEIYERLDVEELIDFINNLELSDGILKFSLVNNSINQNSKEEKKYVINLQKPNRQIWFSSPFSGPQRFEYYKKLLDDKNYWLNKHNKLELEFLIVDEVNNFLINEKKTNLKL